MTSLEKCKAEFTFFTKLPYDENNPIHVSVVEDMKAFKDSIEGREGIAYSSFNGVVETYRKQYPDNILMILSGLRKRVKMW